MAAPALAADADADSSTSDTIVVTASGYAQKISQAPASISVIGREELAEIRFGSLAEALPWAIPWFLAAFLLGCLVTFAVLKLPFWQAVSWWGMALAISLIVGWVGAVGAVLLYRYAILPSFTDFF